MTLSLYLFLISLSIYPSGSCSLLFLPFFIRLGMRRAHASDGEPACFPPHVPHAYTRQRLIDLVQTHDPNLCHSRPTQPQVIFDGEISPSCPAMVLTSNPVLFLVYLG